MPWLPVCFPLAPAVCRGTQFSVDLVRCSCDKLSAAPLTILVLSTVPPSHAKGYVSLVTSLPHVVHWKPDSDRYLTMFPAECHVFHHIHPTPFSRSCRPLQGASWPRSIVPFLIQLPRFEFWRFRRFRVESPLALYTFCLSCCVTYTADIHNTHVPCGFVRVNRKTITQRL